MKRLAFRLDLLWCDVHNTLWAIYGMYAAYRRHAYRPFGRLEAAQRTWQAREFWDR